MKKNISWQFSVAIGGLSALLFGFQNCGSGVNFSSPTTDSTSASQSAENPASTTPPSPTPQPPVPPSPTPTPSPTPPPTCVPGKRLAVWADPDKSGVALDQNYLGSFVSYTGISTTAGNYNYYSASAHPLDGPEPKGFDLNVFFYDGADGLSLNFFANIDAGGSDYNIFNLDAVVTGNSQKDKVLVADDPNSNEFDQVSSSVAGANAYRGRFQYWKNTDGGAIGPFVGDNYKIRVNLLESGDIQNARFYSADGQSFDLSQTSGASSFIIQYESYEDCD